MLAGFSRALHGSARHLAAIRSRQALVAAITVAALLGGGGGAAVAVGARTSPHVLSQFGTSEVGTQADGRVVLPDDQSVVPFGSRTDLGADAVGTAVSPDGTTMAVQTGGQTSGVPAVEILDAATGKVLQTFGGIGIAPPAYSPDGAALYVGTSTASEGSDSGTDRVLKYTVGPNGLVTDPTAPQTLTLPSPRDFPYGFAVSPDGSTLYVALSATNELGVIDTATMTLTATIPVGIAPAAVALVGNEAFVSDRGGLPPGPGATTNNSAGTPVVSSPVTGAATTGDVSVVDLSTDTVTGSISVGLSPGSLTVHDGSVFVTNTGDDTVSIIDAATQQVTQTFSVEPLPGSTVGSSPNSVTFTDGSHLLVSVGGDNAIAEFGYNGPVNPVQYQGLIPTDWYPNQVTYDATTGRVIVSNEYGIGSDGSFQTHTLIGTVTLFSPPSNLTLGTLTSQVFANNGWNHLPASNTAAKGQGRLADGALPAIPAHLGQPSAITHVVLVIKENRTYDQLLGNIGKGNSDPAESDFLGGDLGDPQVATNQRSLADTFSLFDNFYDPAQQSADGHAWVDEADANDYLAQDQAANFPRSYPYPGGDALAYQQDGFLWNTVEAAGKTVRNYGEFESITTGTMGSWQQYYADAQILDGKAAGPLPIAVNSAQFSSDVPSLNAISDPDYPDFNLLVPDEYRAAVWQQEFQQDEASGTMPNLEIIQLPDDHLGGAGTEDAEVSDNDQAVGQIVSDISHSQFWKSSAIFVEEDDTQDGNDHVDGHRGPLFIASPYARRGVINNDYYTQINVDKTIEQILGAQPMNQFDRAAVPMFDAFTNTPNFTPYQLQPPNVPVTQGVSGLIPLSPPAGSSDTKAQAEALAATAGPPGPPVPAAERSVAAAWAAWDRSVALPALSGAHATADSVNPAQLNRYGWYSATNWSRPYPGDPKIYLPDQVPGRNIPGSLLGD